MARKQPLRPNVAQVETGPGVSEADAVAEATTAAHLAQGETALAAAALLPVLDRSEMRGHARCQLAAALVRALQPALQPASHSGQHAGFSQVGSADHLAQTVERLTALLRAQDAELARLQAMLETLL